MIGGRLGLQYSSIAEQVQAATVLEWMQAAERALVERGIDPTRISSERMWAGLFNDQKTV